MKTSMMFTKKKERILEKSHISSALKLRPYLYNNTIVNKATEMTIKIFEMKINSERASIVEDSIENIKSIVTDTNMAMLPLPSSHYHEFMDRIKTYYSNFIEKMDKLEFSDEI